MGRNETTEAPLSVIHDVIPHRETRHLSADDGWSVHLYDGVIVKCGIVIDGHVIHADNPHPPAGTASLTPEAANILEQVIREGDAVPLNGWAVGVEAEHEYAQLYVAHDVIADGHVLNGGPLAAVVPHCQVYRTVASTPPVVLHYIAVN